VDVDDYSFDNVSSNKFNDENSQTNSIKLNDQNDNDDDSDSFGKMIPTLRIFKEDKKK